jgi:hypothetical protein
MRTTLDVDDDVLEAARVIARQKNETIGKIVSDLARRSLHPVAAGEKRNGVPLLPVRNPHARVTTEMVNALRDELP